MLLNTIAKLKTRARIAAPVLPVEPAPARVRRTTRDEISQIFAAELGACSFHGARL